MPDAQQTTDCWRQRPPPEQSGTVADSMVSLAPLRTSNRLLLSAHSTNSQLPPWMIPTVVCARLLVFSLRKGQLSKHARFHFQNAQVYNREEGQGAERDMRGFTRHIKYRVGYCTVFYFCRACRRATTVVAARARDCAGTSRGGARRLVPRLKPRPSHVNGPWPEGCAAFVASDTPRMPSP